MPIDYGPQFPVDFEAWMRNIERRLSYQERRPGNSATTLANWSLREDDDGSLIARHISGATHVLAVPSVGGGGQDSSTTAGPSSPEPSPMERGNDHG